MSRKRSRKTWTRILDELWRKAINQRDKGRCRKCGSSSFLQAAHIHSRKFRSTRWWTENGVLLCAGCHMWAHHNPTSFTRWLDGQIGSEMLAWLERRAGEPQFITESWLQDVEQELLNQTKEETK
jgi:5-methylcytosine-specific restriction endonuclease McrA